MTEAFGPLSGLAIVIPNEVRNLREAIILESIGAQRENRSAAIPRSADFARNDKTAGSAKHGTSLPGIEKFTNSQLTDEFPNK